MGRMSITLDDDLEKEFLKKAVEKFGGRRGYIQNAFEDALARWIREA